MYFIRRLNDSDCGFATLKNLLANIYKNKKYLYLKQDLNKEKYSYYELILKAKDFGLFLNGIEFNEAKDLKQFKDKIFLACLSLNNQKHLVLVKKHKLFLTILDPNCGKYKMSYKKFYSIWDKTILCILNYSEKVVKNDYFLIRKNNVKFRTVFAVLSRILSIISSFLALYFIDNNNFIYISIILFISAFIFEAIYRIMMIFLLKKDDENFNNFYQIKSEYKKDFFSKFQKYKKDSVSIWPNFFSSVLLSGFIILLLLLNNVFSIYFIFFTMLVSFINVAFIKNSFLNEAKHLALKEKNMLGVDYSFLDLKKLSNVSYKIAAKYLFIESLITGLIVLLVVISLLINNVFSIPFIVFYSVLLIFFKKQFEVIIQIKSEQIKLNTNYCLILNMLDDNNE